jgi:YVTN family beta-propeller protein
LSAVIVIDTSSNTELGTQITVGSSPLGLAITPDGKEIYVANNDQAGSVSVIDSSTNSVVATLSGMAYPFAAAFSPDGKLAYVTGGGVGFTLVIDTTTRAVVDSIPLGGNAIAVTLDGKQVYVTNENGNTVSAIDTASNTVTATLTGMNSPRGVAVRPIPPGIPVPSVVGTSQSAATTAIAGAGLIVGMVTQQASTSVAPGDVISQLPAAGVLVGANAMVALVVSSGVAVPNVTGQTQAQASTAIGNAGLVLGTVTRQNSSTVPSGDVISQSPEGGAKVAGGTAVNLIVSSGSGGGGGGSMKPLTLLGLLALLSVGWRRTRRAILLSEQELDSGSGDSP